MMARLGARIAAFFRATAPDPFVLAVLLTLLTVVLAVTIADWGSPAPTTWEQRLVSITGAWRIDPATAEQTFTSAWAPPDGAPSQGLWYLLAFAMQMCLILVTGHALATSPPVARLIRALAALPRSGAQAVALVAFAAAALALLNWGLALIAGALLAREVGAAMHARNRPVHYPLLAAAGYVGLLVWHGGFSGSAPLTVTTHNGIAKAIAGTTAAGAIEPIPLTHTLLSPLNLAVTGGLILLAPIILALMHPRTPRDDDDDNDSIAPPSAFTPGHTATDADESLPHDMQKEPVLIRILEDTPLINLALVALIALWALAYYFPGLNLSFAGIDLALGDPRAQSGARTLTLNTVNLTMLALGLILQGTPARYLSAVEDGARACAGIILQFPLYAGIIGVMTVSGLAAQFAGAMTSASNQTTLPILTFISAAVVNLFVPSGGGQWAIQGPIALEAAHNTGVPPATIVMAVAYGDQLTNMLQPFWALPLLAITGVRARDIVGYTAILMVAAAVWIVACLVLFK